MAAKKKSESAKGKIVDWSSPEMKKARRGTGGNRDLPTNATIPGPYGRGVDVGAESDPEVVEHAEEPVNDAGAE